MAKMSLGKLSNPAFSSAMQELLRQKLPVKTAFKVKTIVNKCNDELKKFSELRAQILNSHCKKKEDGTPDLDSKQNYQFDNEAITVVTKEMNDLLSIELEIETLKLEELGDISLSPDELFSLGEIIDA